MNLSEGGRSTFSSVSVVKPRKYPQTQPTLAIEPGPGGRSFVRLARLADTAPLQKQASSPELKFLVDRTFTGPERLGEYFEAQLAPQLGELAQGKRLLVLCFNSGLGGSFNFATSPIADGLERLLRRLVELGRGLPSAPSLLLAVSMQDGGRRVDLLTDFRRGTRATDLRIDVESLAGLRDLVGPRLKAALAKARAPILSFKISLVLAERVGTMTFIESLPNSEGFDQFLASTYLLVHEKKAVEKYQSSVSILNDLEARHSGVSVVSFISDSKKRADSNFFALNAQQRVADFLANLNRFRRSSGSIELPGVALLPDGGGFVGRSAEIRSSSPSSAEEEPEPQSFPVIPPPRTSFDPHKSTKTILLKSTLRKPQSPETESGGREMRELRRFCAYLQEQNDRHILDNRTLKDRVRLLEGEKSELDKKLRCFSEKSGDLEGRKASLEGRAAALEKELAGSEAELAADMGVIQRLNCALNAQKVAAENAIRRLEEREKETLIDRKNDEIRLALAEERLRALTQSATEDRTRRAQLEAEKSVLKEKNRRLKYELESLRSELEVAKISRGRTGTIESVLEQQEKFLRTMATKDDFEYL